MTQRSFRQLMESVLWDYRFHRNTMSDFGPGGYDIDPSTSQFRQCFGIPSSRHASHAFSAPAAFTHGTFEFTAMIGFEDFSDFHLGFVYGDNWTISIENTGTRISLVVGLQSLASGVRYLIYGSGGANVANPGDVAHIVVSFSGAANTTISATVNGSSLVTSTNTMSVSTPNATDSVFANLGSPSFLAGRFFTIAMTESEQHQLYREARKIVPGYIFQPISPVTYFDGAGGGGEEV